MITWMQHNKKYLIVTLWISAIAFIGAGFVGWGSYQYGSKNRSIAKVGEVEIKMSELQMTYSNLYSYYSQMFDGNFDEAKAKELKLEESAFNILKREALLINVANEFGLKVLDEEIAENIFQNKNFFKDGNFSKEQYLLILKNSSLNPKEYEDRLAKVIIISKIQELLKVDSTPFEEDVINSITKLKDQIEYKVLTYSDITVNATTEEIKNLWEMTKSNYMTEEQYTITYIESYLIEKDFTEEELQNYFNINGLEYSDTFENSKEQVKEDLLKKASKKSAMKEYIAFKKDKFSGDSFTATIGEVNFLTSSESMQELKNLNIGEVLKPRFYNGRFITMRLDSVISPKIESFENVEYAVKDSLLGNKRDEALLELAKNSYTNFSGIKTELVSVTDGDKIEGIYPQEANQLLNYIFTQSTDKGFVTFESKVVIYKVLEQKIDQSLKNDLENSVISNLKEKILDDNLIKKLEYFYSVETYFKG